ncbi:MAG: 4'-phosphopantetheinyl transferase superfamily protein [Clostridiales bacterium]|nr:4'-phosphopantetheinyl transferase superfamily protein [Clostridiales bacterium]
MAACAEMKIRLLAARPKEGESLHQAAHRLLALAAEEAGLPPDLALGCTPEGKPVFPDAPGFHFNLSHAAGWAVCAVAPCPVGVDLEGERPLRANVARQFSPTEQAQLAALPPAAFFDLWVLKEAAAKCTGRCGMRGVLRGSEVTLHPLSVGVDGIGAALVSFPEEGLHLAVCAATEESLEPELTIL